MKRLSIALIVALALAALVATPALGRTMKARASVKQTSATKVVFTTKVSRSGHVRIVVYHGRHAVKRLTAHRSARSRTLYYATWYKPASASGTYTYRLVASASHVRTKVVRGKVKVWKPAPAPAPAPVVVPVTPVVASTPSPSSSSSRWIGLYVPGSPQDMAPLEAAEAVDGVHTKVVNFYVSDSESFPRPRCQAVADHDSIPLVTLEFWSIGTTGLSAITNGSKDAYIRKFADDAKSYGGEVWLRPFHEMNGNWYPWGGSVGNNSAAKLVSAWKHVHAIFVAEGATNVKFVWCVNNDSVPSGSANAISAYWPGNSYVDYAAMDGYNSGTTQSWSSWRPFSSVFGAAYSTVVSLTSKPVLIAETGSVEQGGSKAAWIADMFSVIPSHFPHLIGVCWFDAHQTYDWRIDSSSTSAAAFRAGATKGF
jgi:Glycosyl hydrolase family 26